MMILVLRSVLVLALLFGLVFAVGMMVNVYLGSPTWTAVFYAVLVVLLQYLLGPFILERLFTINRSIDSAGALGKRDERASVTRIPRADHLADRLAHNSSRLGGDPTLGYSARSTADYILFAVL